jgi:hypothetical protein
MRSVLSIILYFPLAMSAHGWDVQVDVARMAGVEVKQLNVHRSGDQVRIAAGMVVVADAQFTQQRVAWDCTLSGDWGQGMLCDGKVSAGTPSWQGSLRLEHSQQQTTAALRVGKTRLDWQAPTGGPGRLTAQKLPLAWLQPRLTEAWADLASISGSADADLTLGGNASRLSGTLALNDVNFDSRLGDIAGAGLSLAGKLDIGLGKYPKVLWKVARPVGQILLGAVYFELPASDSLLEINAAVDDKGAWQLPMLAWRDADGLEFKAAAHRSEPDHLDVRIIQMSAELAPVSKRYLGTALATAGFEGLDLQGRVSASGRFIDGAWQAFDVDLQNVRIADPAERIQVGDLDAELRMDAIAAVNTLQWKQARIYRIPLGDSSVRWHWTPERLLLAEPLSLAMLGGTLRLPSLERRRVDGHSDWRGAIELDQLDVLNLTTALDLPHFSGSLSGRLPGFHFREGGFTAEGDIEFKVFDGQMRVSGFSSERTFGVAPTLGADIAFDNLDLKQLSSVLDFGEIAGWLDGEIKGLRMLDWAPMAFDARLRTDSKYPGRRRISQRAVQGLSSVGGGGSVMSSPIMRLVDSFGYAEIGLNCRLVDNVCEMGGLDRSGAGYTILRGAGLPRLTVVGHQRKVDWPVLLSRLQAVSSGQAPVIE